MRVVLDANVFVSGAIHAGPSHRIVQRWLAHGHFEVIICPVLLAEIDEVLTQRPRLRRWIDAEVARRYVDTVAALVDLVPDPSIVGQATRDVGDDYLVALARQHEVDFIVTGARTCSSGVSRFLRSSHRRRSTSRSAARRVSLCKWIANGSWRSRAAPSEHDAAGALLHRSIATARRLSATTWVAGSR